MIETRGERPNMIIFRLREMFKAGVRFSPLFSFLYFYMPVSFRTSETITSIDQDKISEEIFENLWTNSGEIHVNFKPKFKVTRL